MMICFLHFLAVQWLDSIPWREIPEYQLLLFFSSFFFLSQCAWSFVACDALLSLKKSIRRQISRMKYRRLLVRVQGKRKYQFAFWPFMVGGVEMSSYCLYSFVYLVVRGCGGAWAMTGDEGL